MIETKRANKLRYFEKTIGKTSSTEWDNLEAVPLVLIQGIPGYCIQLHTSLLSMDTKRLTLWDEGVFFRIVSENTNESFVSNMIMKNAGYFKKAGASVFPVTGEVHFSEGSLQLRTDGDYVGAFEGYATIYGYYTLIASEN